ncbi:sensor histidine kinase [Piscinibacter sakaiensis]|uniref:sensor histidine kinase n=1 Tax=Piscinibacter sakaiensis TaxID=1547922 RepID=UPI0009E6F499|nr:ATP-binding protein [Piscinibacter sakaiensis]
MTEPPSGPPGPAAGSGGRPADPRRGDRRRRRVPVPPEADRRQVDRRAGPRSQPASSWFAPIDDELASRLPGEAPTSSRSAGARGAGEPEPSTTAFGRIHRVFLGARAALGLILVTMLVVTGFFGIRPSVLLASVSIGYAGVAISMWLLPRFGRGLSPQAMARPQSPQWLATIGLDSVCFVTLHVLSPMAGFNYAALLVLPVMMAGVLTPRLLALATCAAIALALLGNALVDLAAGADPAALLTQAGLVGSGLFFITVLAGELAGRLAREEQAARGSRELARQQAQLNRLVIEEMQDGVLVVDQTLRVRAANPAARRLLAAQGICRPAPFDLRGLPAWQALAAEVASAFGRADWPAEGRDVTLAFDPGLSRTVRVRLRFARRGELAPGEDHAVLFLEDLRSMQARVRQEKLAAMGRVSVGIAHEIRNPLAAIAQANGLMAEDAVSPAQRQLTRLVSDNVERLKRIVDDVMEVAPGAVVVAARIDLAAAVAAVCADWAAAARLPIGPLRLDLPGEVLWVRFDAEHLRRVLVNLLDNAWRHASGAPGSIAVRVYRAEGRAVLSVASDGPPIPPEVERHLFEPFHSTRSRGTGLGLYICRELCERYGAGIDYRTRPATDPHRNDFSVVMQPADAAPADAPPASDPPAVHRPA